MSRNACSPLFCLGGEKLQLLGRRKIYTDEQEVTEANIVDVIGEAYATHQRNRREVQRLYDYYRGKHKIYNRTKEVRPEIKNMVVVNRPNEIVTFKTSYFLFEPVQYVMIGSDDAKAKEIDRLNKFMRMESKLTKDKELVDWFHIGGNAIRMALPSKGKKKSPFSIYILDPRDAFVIYNSGIAQEKLVGVIRQKNKKGQWMFCAYTSTEYFEVTENVISRREPHVLGQPPLFEYTNNQARQGAFETVLSQVDSINLLESNRLDAVEQRVQSFLVFENCEIDREKYAELRKDGALLVKSDTSNPAKVYPIDVDLPYEGVQTAIDAQYEAIITICGMPNRNGGASTSDTGSAVVMRDGWANADARAKDSEDIFKCPEMEFVDFVIQICHDTVGMDLSSDDIDIKFNRNNHSNFQSNVQCLIQMLGNEKVHPQDAYSSCEVFPDSGAAFANGMKWYNEQQKKLQDTPPLDDGTAEKPTNPNSGDAEQKPTNTVQRST